MLRLKRASRSGKKVRALTIEIWVVVVLAAIWGVFVALRQPWYISLAFVLVVVGLVDGVVQLSYRRFGPLPPIGTETKSATVTGTRRTPDEKATLVTLSVGDGDERYDSVLADIPTATELDRFEVGSEWSVHEFVDCRDRVVLTDDYDDLARSGYDLCGVRRDKERVLFLDQRLGSEILRRAERPQDLAEDAEAATEPAAESVVESDSAAAEGAEPESKPQPEEPEELDSDSKPVGTPQMRTAADGDAAAVDADEPRT